jgi:hypothetical protein
MPTQIVMDANGDSRHSFDPADEIELLRAEDRFCELLKNGYTAASRNGKRIRHGYMDIRPGSRG